jgi:hypothetical protein
LTIRCCPLLAAVLWFYSGHCRIRLVASRRKKSARVRSSVDEEKKSSLPKRKTGVGEPRVVGKKKKARAKKNLEVPKKVVDERTAAALPARERALVATRGELRATKYRRGKKPGRLLKPETELEHRRRAPMKSEFCRMLKVGNDLRRAAFYAGLSSVTVEEWRKIDSEFDDAVSAAEREAASDRPLKKIKFVEELRGCGIVAHAAKAVGVTTTTIYNWKDSDEDFATACDDAAAEANARIEEASRTRALGYKAPILYRGEITGEYDAWSERQLELQLKANVPKYRDRVSVTGEDGGPLQIEAIERVIVHPDNKKKEDGGQSS